MICVYPAGCTDFSANGNGTLSPLSAEVTETLNGEYELTLVHPIDDAGKWLRLVEGCILRAPVPAAMTPRISLVSDTPGASTMIYRVNTGGDRLRLRSGAGTNFAALGYYAPGTEVVVIEKTTAEWYEVACPDGKRGYMYAAYLTYMRTETTPGAAVSQVVEARQLRDQPFRIYRVVPERDKVTVYARHIFYDLMDNMIRSYKPSASTPGASVVQGIGGNCLSEHNFTFWSDLDDTAEDVSFTNVNPIEALLGEGGVSDRYGGELARDWYDVYVVKRVGGDSGMQIREGKNLLGISYDVDVTNVTTRVMPTGEDADGNILYLPELYVDSPVADHYPHIRWTHLPVEEAKEVTKGDAPELKNREQCYAEMRQAAQDTFNSGCDLPDVTLNVDFINCADTEEYRQYGFLQSIYLGDTVRVIAPRIGVWVSMRMTQYTYDCLLKKYTGMTLGTVADTVAGNMISARQLPSGIISGAKLAINSVGSGQIRNGAVGAMQVQMAAIQTAHIEDAAITRAKIAEATVDTLTANAVTAVRADIRQLVAGAITTDQLYADLATIAVAQLTTAHISSAQIDWAQITNLMADAVTAVRADIRQLVAGSITTDQLYADLATIATAQLTTAHISSAQIDWAQITNLMADAVSAVRADIRRLVAEAITTDQLYADLATIATAQINTANIDTANINWAQIQTLTAQIAAVVSLAAQDGQFDFAKVKDLVSEAMILEQGVGGSVYIKNLAATTASFVSAAVGELVLGSTDGKYYRVDITGDGTIHTEEVTVTQGEISAGVTADGRAIVATEANVAALNAQSIKAESAIISDIFARALTVGALTASEAFISSATVPELYATAIRAVSDTLDLSANEQVRIMVGDYVKSYKSGTRNYIPHSLYLKDAMAGIVDLTARVGTARVGFCKVG